MFYNIKEMSTMECVICFESLDDKNRPPAIIKHCGHVYHKECLEPWFKQKRNCPSCRIHVNKYYNGKDEIQLSILDSYHPQEVVVPGERRRHHIVFLIRAFLSYICLITGGISLASFIFLFNDNKK